MCRGCSAKHCIVDCPDGKYHIGKSYPQCNECGVNHDRVIPCDHAKEYSIKWKQELAMWEMYYNMEKYRRRKRKFHKVKMDLVAEVYQEWLYKEEEEEFRQKKFWENLKDLSQFPKEQPLQSM